jgi:hypothetical protein
MLTVRLGSVALQDPSWGGPGTLTVPRGPEGRVRSVRCRGVRDGHSAQRDEVSVLSLRLFGLVEITQTRTSRRSA